MLQYLVSTGFDKSEMGLDSKIHNMTIETNEFLETELSFLYDEL